MKNKLDYYLAERFFEFEKQNNLFQRKYLGIYYWQNIRDMVWRMAYQKMAQVHIDNMDDSEGEKSKLRKMHKLLLCAVKDITYFRRISHCDILYFDKAIYRECDGGLKDVHFDYWGFEEDYKIERIYYNQYDNNIKTPGLSISWAQWGCINKYIVDFWIRKRVDNAEEEFIRSLFASVERKLQINLSVSEIIQCVRKEVAREKSYRKYYERLLNKTTPKAIFVVCHYDERLYPLYLVARKKKIPVIELQHGLIYKLHQYTYYDKEAKGKKLPAYIFTYGTFWNNNIQIPKGVRAIAIGNPFTEDMVLKYMKNKASEKTIAIFSAPGLIGLWKTFVNVFIKKYGEEGWLILFKPHPREICGEKEKKGWPEQVKIIKKELDVYQVLSISEHHVSVGSASLFESVMFEAQRYIYACDEGFKDGIATEMKPLIDMHLARSFRTPEELHMLLVGEKLLTDKGEREKFYASKAKENARTALKSIIKERKRKPDKGAWV